MADEQFIIRTPRASRLGLIVAFILFALTAALLYGAYRGWQLHQTVGF